ncbi:MAG: shikimate dehydrogenase [Clostridiales Family XIII bacterium]|jgi:shikimate dehydrogenase|nr:shikimate dehydrogenase [Clostridiales Family XIII bacterium]
MKYAVIGDPVAHSISPALHAVVFERLGLDVRYDKVRVRGDDLAAFVSRMKSGKDEGGEGGEGGGEAPLGVNVTIPHKKAILPLIDEVRGDALLAGAVNTVVREGGYLAGYNTDMEGLLLSLVGAGSGYKDKAVCIFGTGGAALGAAVKAAGEGAKTVRVIGRNKKKADEVCMRTAAAANAIVAAIAYDGHIPAQAVLDTDVFINATPLGMQGYSQDFDDLGFLDALPKTALVYDCVYIPAETALVHEARARGLRAENGLSMLVWQGLLSDVHFLRAAGETRFTKAEILSQEMFSAVYQTLERTLL